MGTPAFSFGFFSRARDIRVFRSLLRFNDFDGQRKARQTAYSLGAHLVYFVGFSGNHQRSGILGSRLEREIKTGEGGALECSRDRRFGRKYTRR